MEEHDPGEIYVGLLKFRDAHGHELVILLRDRLCSVRGYHRQLSAHAYLQSRKKEPNKRLSEFLNKVDHMGPPTLDNLLEPPGITWKQPNGRVMSLVLKRQVNGGKRRILIDFNYERAELYAKDGRKATLTVN